MKIMTFLLTNPYVALLLCLALFVIIRCIFLWSKARHIYTSLCKEFNAKYILDIRFISSLDNNFLGNYSHYGYILITDKEFIILLDPETRHQFHIPLPNIKYYTYQKKKSRLILYYYKAGEQMDLELQLNNNSFNLYARLKNNIFNYLEANFNNTPAKNITIK